MAGRHRFSAEIFSHVQKIAELHRLIATYAGDRRLAAQVGVGEIVDHRLAKAAFIIKDVMRHSQAFCRLPGVANVLTGAAGARLLNRRTVVVELQRYAHHVIASALQQGRGHGGIHPTRHGRHNPRARRQADSRPRRIGGGRTSGDFKLDRVVQRHEAYLVCLACKGERWAERDTTTHPKRAPKRTCADRPKRGDSHEDTP
jgi:hypothetical protein